MKAKLKIPLKVASGKIAGLQAGYYARTNRKTGVVTIAKIVSPYAKHGPSEAQKAQWERFAEMARERWRGNDNSNPNLKEQTTKKSL